MKCGLVVLKSLGWAVSITGGSAGMLQFRAQSVYQTIHTKRSWTNSCPCVRGDRNKTAAFVLLLPYVREVRMLYLTLFDFVVLEINLSLNGSQELINGI
jgi:hypothetical protein